MSKINEPILVLTCDNIFRIDFKKIYHEYIKLKSPACLLIPVKPIENLRGDYIHYSSNNIITMISKTKKTDLYCSGIQILNPFKINCITNPTSNFIYVWNQLIKTYYILARIFLFFFHLILKLRPPSLLFILYGSKY